MNSKEKQREEKNSIKTNSSKQIANQSKKNDKTLFPFFVNQ